MLVVLIAFNAFDSSINGLILSIILGDHLGRIITWVLWGIIVAGFIFLFWLDTHYKKKYREEYRL